MTRTTQQRRTGVATVAALGSILGSLVGLLLVVLPAGAAQAAAYRYWGYYQLNGTTWAFATKGPDQTTPADGSVEGWRFAVGTEDATRFPRATPSFDDICGKAVAKAGEKVAEGKSPLRAGLSAAGESVKSSVGNAIKGATGGKGGGKKVKVTNIVEQIDVGAPIDVVYDQWTQFQDFSNFMKKVENVDQNEDQKLEFKAQILWSHRTWQATILEQVPDERIIWRSSGDKGRVDGAVTFHELAPDLTRVIVVLEYHPQGLFERTGNLWRAQGRRARLELKHFQRHVMAHALLHPDDVEG